MPRKKVANTEPIPGYRLLEPLGSGGFGEVWKCEAPGGLFKAIKFVYGDLNSLNGARAQEELRAVERIKAIRHPFLVSMERVEIIDGELVIVMELADKSLQDLLASRQREGQPGIARAKLLGFLREAAEVLDLIHQEHRLQHLDVKPRNLFVVSHHVKVADFGLVQSLIVGHAGSKQINMGAITPLYAAPEVFLGQVSQHSDQYSLAIVYQELLTGKLPFAGRNSRQLLLEHTQKEPDLHDLPVLDQAAVARALSKEPDKRFPSCMDFIQALVSASAEPGVRSDAISHPSTKAPVPHRPAADTVRIHIDETVRARVDMPLPPSLVPGYRFFDCQGRSPLVDQWRAQAPDGQERVVKIIYGFVAGERFKDAVRRLKSLQHPGLMETEIIANDSGGLVLVSEPAKETLRGRLGRCLARKQAGIMRGELLEYMGTAAEVVDYLYQQHSIQHLGLNPRNLVLSADGRMLVEEFGLAHLLWLPSGQDVADRNGRYAPPELFDRQASRSGDQYSLAVIYHEMLTGTHPFLGIAANQGRARTLVKPSLDRLPEPDQEIIARALDPDPLKRWPSCLAMVSALEGRTVEQTDGEAQTDHFAAFLSAARARPVTNVSPAAQGNLNQLITDLIGSAAGDPHPAHGQGTQALSANGDQLEYAFQAGLPLGSARVKLEECCQQWYGQLVSEDEHGSVFHVNLPANFWAQWIGRQPGLEVRVDLARVHPLTATPIEATVRIRPFRCSKKRGDKLLQEMGPGILDCIRNYLLVNSEKRTQDRLLWPHPVTICPLFADGSQGEAIECPGKDISPNGIGFYLQEEMETAEVIVHLPNAITVPATLVRAKRCADGWYEVGALFRLSALRKNLPESCPQLTGN